MAILGTSLPIRAIVQMAISDHANMIFGVTG
jgi:hypothetical protein